MSSMLSKDDVEKAERGEGYEQHPVIDILDRYQRLYSEQSEDGYRWLGGQLEDKMPYSLDSLDLIAIWSRISDIMTLPDIYRFATGLLLAYAVHRHAKDVTGNYFLSGRLPDNLTSDPAFVEHVRRIAYDITRSIDNIGHYITGCDQDQSSLAIALARRKIAGDQRAEREIELLKRRVKEYKTPVLEKLQENFGNGIFSLRLALGNPTEE